LLDQARAATGRERDEALLRALSAVLERGLGLHTGALTVSEVRDALGSVERVEPALVDAVADLVSELTRGRYAPGAGSPQTLIERASQTLDALFDVSEPHRVQTSPGGHTAILLVGMALGLCATLLSPSVAQAQPEATQEDAAQSWEANDFGKASRSWAQAAAEAADPALWFNAGTAALRAGETGLARLYLERAALTHARHPDVAKNLQTAVNL